MKSFVHLKEKLDKADIRVLAFDIETTKQPLKFPDVKFDQVMMISYIVDGSGFLITNRAVVGEDVTDFEYAPREDYDVGKFTIFNEINEQALLRKFFDHIKETKPTVFTTFNGDAFDWPFIQARADFHKIKMAQLNCEDFSKKWEISCGKLPISRYFSPTEPKKIPIRAGFAQSFFWWGAFCPNFFPRNFFCP